MRNYTIDNLNNVDFFTELNEEINKIEFHNDTNEALKILRGLQKAIQENKQKINNDLIMEYKDMMARLRFVLFLNQSDSEVLELLKEHLVIGIKMTYVDLLEMLKTRISFIVLPDRDEYKKQIIKIILNNQEKITNKSMKAGEENIRPTILNWLKDYNRYLGTGHKNNLEQSKYYLNNKNFIKLDKLEKLELKELFSIYEYLKRSSATLQGNEDNIIMDDIDGKTYILQSSKFIDISPTKEKRAIKKGSMGLSPPKTQSEKKIDELKQEEKQYAKGGLEEKALEEEIGKEKEIENLQYMADKYPEGSLERKAVRDEIDKLKS